MPNKLYKQFKCLDKTASGIVTKAYNEYKFPVPFKPPVGISDRFMQITIDDFPKGSLLESYFDYSQSELLTIHMRRLGNMRSIHFALYGYCWSWYLAFPTVDVSI